MNSTNQRHWLCFFQNVFLTSVQILCGSFSPEILPKHCEMFNFHREFRPVLKNLKEMFSPMWSPNSPIAQDMKKSSGTFLKKLYLEVLV